MTETEYNVSCMNCGQVWTPGFRSPLWWQAKKRADEGFLDAICVQGEQCGCVKKQHNPTAPFRVYGYDSMCQDFDIPFETFISAIKKFLDANRSGYVVFITGVSKSLQRRLDYM